MYGELHSCRTCSSRMIWFRIAGLISRWINCKMIHSYYFLRGRRNRLFREVFNTWLDKALSSPLRSCSWPCFEQDVALHDLPRPLPTRISLWLNCKIIHPYFLSGKGKGNHYNTAWESWNISNHENVGFPPLHEILLSGIFCSGTFSSLIRFFLLIVQKLKLFMLKKSPEQTSKGNVSKTYWLRSSCWKIPAQVFVKHQRKEWAEPQIKNSPNWI